MADEFDPDAFLKQTAPKEEGAFDPDTFLKETAPAERGIMQRAGEAVLEAGKSGWEAAKKMVSPPTQEEAKDYLGPSGALRSLKETGAGIASLLTPITAPIAGVESLAASGLGAAQRGVEGLISKGVGLVSPEAGKKLESNIPTSEQAYETAKPYAEAALSAVGAKRAKMPTDFIRPEIIKPSPTQKAAGEILEESATDPEKVKTALESPQPPIVAGSEPTTYQLTGDPGLGQLERTAQIAAPDQFLTRRAEQNRARLQTLEEVQASGSPEAVADHLRTGMHEADTQAHAATQLAEHRAWEATQALGGQHDPQIYGAVLRQELQQAEEAARTNERALWRSVDPDGSLLVNPQAVQELERNVYGRLTETAAASLTPREQQIAGLIQGYRPATSFREMVDLRSLVSSALREERMTNGASPAYARLSQLRSGIEDAVVNRAIDAQTGQFVQQAAQRLQAASAATRERANRFNVSPLREIMRREGVEGPYRMQVGAVPGRIVVPGPAGHDNASAFLRAVGNQEGMPVIQDAVVGEMRRSNVFGADGAINPRNLERWIGKHADILRALDERDGGAFSQRIRNAGTAAEQVGEIAARRAAIETEATQGIFGKLINATDPEDISRTIGRIFTSNPAIGGDQSVQKARALASQLTTPAAREGAQKAIVDYIKGTFISNMEAGNTEQNLIRADAFQKFVRRNGAALSQFFSGPQVRNLAAIADDIQRANRSIGTKLPGGSNTPQDLFRMGKVKNSILSNLIMQGLLTKIGGKYLPGFTTALKGAASMLRDAGVKDVQDLVTKAMLDPTLANDLLKKNLGARTLPGLKRWMMYETATQRPSEPTPTVHTLGTFRRGGAIRKEGKVTRTFAEGGNLK